MLILTKSQLSFAGPSGPHVKMKTGQAQLNQPGRFNLLGTWQRPAIEKLSDPRCSLSSSELKHFWDRPKPSEKPAKFRYQPGCINNFKPKAYLHKKKNKEQESLLEQAISIMPSFLFGDRNKLKPTTDLITDQVYVVKPRIFATGLIGKTKQFENYLREALITIISVQCASTDSKSTATFLTDQKFQALRLLTDLTEPVWDRKHRFPDSHKKLIADLTKQNTAYKDEIINDLLSGIQDRCKTASTSSTDTVYLYQTKRLLEALSNLTNLQPNETLKCKLLETLTEIEQKLSRLVNKRMNYLLKISTVRPAKQLVPLNLLSTKEFEDNALQDTKSKLTDEQRRDIQRNFTAVHQSINPGERNDRDAVLLVGLWGAGQGKTNIYSDIDTGQKALEKIKYAISKGQFYNNSEQKRLEAWTGGYKPTNPLKRFPVRNINTSDLISDVPLSSEMLEIIRVQSKIKETDHKIKAQRKSSMHHPFIVNMVTSQDCWSPDKTRQHFSSNNDIERLYHRILFDRPNSNNIPSWAVNRCLISAKEIKSDGGGKAYEALENGGSTEKTTTDICSFFGFKPDVTYSKTWKDEKIGSSIPKDLSDLWERRKYLYAQDDLLEEGLGDQVIRELTKRIRPFEAPF